ncbi:MAG: hypothetical protein ACK5NE_01555, partial [Brachymonas sp.]
FALRCSTVSPSLARLKPYAWHESVWGQGNYAFRLICATKPYYVSKSEARFGAPGKRYERLPAAEIEAAVEAQIRTVLTSPESIASVVRHIQRNPSRSGPQINEDSVVLAMARLNNVWDQLFPVERHRIANLMIERVDLVHVGEMQGIKVRWREIGWNALIEEFAPDSIGAEMLEIEA